MCTGKTELLTQKMNEQHAGLYVGGYPTSVHLNYD
jgi:hypothetical protein